MSQLKEVASSLRTKFHGVINNLRSENTSIITTEEGEYSEESMSSVERKQTDQGTSLSNSYGTPKASAPIDGERASKVIESLVSTLFGACSGTTNCPTDSYFESGRDNQDFIHSIQKKREAHSRRRKSVSETGHGAKSKARSRSAASLHAKSSPKYRDKDESYYAQFYEDDHAKAAKAVLATKQKEAKQREDCRQRLENLTREAHQEANQHRSNNPTSHQHDSPSKYRTTDPDSFTPHQHRERIQVGGTPYRLCEVALPTSQSAVLLNEEEDVASYNYDDGISALSAHTLEEMAKMEARLVEKEGIPSEQGFDIHTAETAADLSRSSTSSGPPGLSSTDDSAETNSHLDEPADNDDKGNVRVDHSLDYEDQYGDEVGQMTYPVQMARHRSTKSSGSFTTKSSKSDFSSVWKRQEQQYWMQVVEEDGPMELAVASTAAKKAASKPEKKTKQSNKNSKKQHPHETVAISTSDVLVPKQRKKKSRGRSLFGRRKGYVTYQEDEDALSDGSPMGRILGDGVAEV